MKGWLGALKKVNAQKKTITPQILLIACMYFKYLMFYENIYINPSYQQEKRYNVYIYMHV